MAEPIFERNRNPSSANHLACSYSHGKTSTQPGSPDVGKGMESIKRAGLYCSNEKEAMSFLVNLGFMT